MLDPRIYRAALVPVALAVVVLAFSLVNQQGPLGTSLAPDAFNTQNAWSTMTQLARDYPNRAPGSASDQALAGYVSNVFTRHKYVVTNDLITAQTAVGKRTLETVTGVRPGFSSRPIVVVAHRDARGSPASAEMSGTATLLELARVLSGRTLSRTVVLVSTSGSVGSAGASALARRFGSSADAVLVLGDLASTRLRYPLVVPFSSAQQVAPPLLRNTIAAALSAQAGLSAGGLSLGGQFVRLAFPLSSTEQGPFGAQGAPSVLLSASGERGPGAGAVPSQSRLAGFGRAALQTISALEDGYVIPSPGPYLIYDKKILPAWPVRLLVLSLILPVLAASIDGYARARRRGLAVGRWIVWVLAGALPFGLAALLVLALKLSGLLHPTPPGPVSADAIPPHAAGIAILASIAAIIMLSLAFLRPLLARAAGARGEPGTSGACSAVPLVMCAASLALWVSNPFAAALVVPALNLWLWMLAPEVRLRRWARVGLLLLGLAPLALVAVYYALTLGEGPLGLAWTVVLMLAGGALTLLTALEWSLVLGCVVSATTLALRAAGAHQAEGRPITVRGPITYAGPGSLGGTKSALRR